MNLVTKNLIFAMLVPVFSTEEFFNYSRRKQILDKRVDKFPWCWRSIRAPQLRLGLFFCSVS
ncbi:hypothetical protein XBJ1_3854 [Xenorhabdus bovienii SS-2004]|uniref:Uncharacterized protein n=1 Tax=Xenorhabdus bovienii (strain SS-2004) TaxID=406818 RepID=D3V5P3_XENBS|nr:hypothetical protein XBJ1_3854 [Xenorhabdus bovienii SS-2004]